MRYEIRFAQCVREHMKFLAAAERSTLLDAIREQLADEPLVETRNRKPLRPNPLAPWELRVGALRAFYDVRLPGPKFEALADVVYVLAVGKKERNLLLFDRRGDSQDMKTVALSTASRSLAEYASELDDEVVLLTKRNRPFAAIVPLRNVDRESLTLSTHPGFLALIERSRRDVAAGKSLSFAEMRAALPTERRAADTLPSAKRRGRTSRSRRRPKAGRA